MMIKPCNMLLNTYVEEEALELDVEDVAAGWSMACADCDLIHADGQIHRCNMLLGRQAAALVCLRCSEQVMQVDHWRTLTMVCR